MANTLDLIVFSCMLQGILTFGHLFDYHFTINSYIQHFTLVPTHNQTGFLDMIMLFLDIVIFPIHKVMHARHIMATKNKGIFSKYVSNTI